MTLAPSARSVTPARHDRMPYRVFLAQIGERLRLTYEGRANGYESARQFRDDVRAHRREPRRQQGRQRRPLLHSPAAAPHRHLRLSSREPRCAPARERAPRDHRPRQRRSRLAAAPERRAAATAGGDAGEGRRSACRSRCARQTQSRRLRGVCPGEAPLRTGCGRLLHRERRDAAPTMYSRR